MSTYFNAHPVTPAMGLRESINAMLAHVAYNRHDFGYLPRAIYQANHEGILDDYAPIVVDNSGVLVLAPVVADSELLADLTDTLERLCNDYPAYNDTRVHQIEEARLIEACEEALTHPLRPVTDVEPWQLARALFEIGAYIEQSEYGADFSESDYDTALTYAREAAARTPGL